MDLRDPRWKLADEIPDIREGQLPRLSNILLIDLINSHKMWIEYRGKKQPEAFKSFLALLKEVTSTLVRLAVALRMNPVMFKACLGVFDKPVNPAQQSAYSRITLGLGGARAAAADMLQDARDLGPDPSADLSMFGANLIGVMDSLIGVVRVLKLDYKPFVRARAELTNFFEDVSLSLLEGVGDAGTAQEVPFESIRLAQKVARRFEAAMRVERGS